MLKLQQIKRGEEFGIYRALSPLIGKCKMQTVPFGQQRRANSAKISLKTLQDYANCKINREKKKMQKIVDLQ